MYRAIGKPLVIMPGFIGLAVHLYAKESQGPPEQRGRAVTHTAPLTVPPIPVPDRRRPISQQKRPRRHPA